MDYSGIAHSHGLFHAPGRVKTHESLDSLREQQEADRQRRHAQKQEYRSTHDGENQPRAERSYNEPNQAMRERREDIRNLRGVVDQLHEKARQKRGYFG